MKKTLLIIFICFSLIGSLYAQEKERNFTTNLIEKGVFDPNQPLNPEMGIQLANKYKPRAAILGMFVSDDGGTASNAVLFSRTAWLDFNIEFMSYYNSKIKFHYIFTGPEFWYFADDSWSSIRANRIYVQQLTSFDDWVLGLYNLTIIVEVQNLASGSALTHTSCYILY